MRPDVTSADVVVPLRASGRIVEATSGVASQAWRRHLHVVLDGFRATNRHDLPRAPLDDAQLHRAVARPTR
ncbi:hypothetical protein [Umezawaea sp.]|uniref:hypothetical protein n=1 Tax=Umezawaea sp. TaxID=1955258 RepID=UPI002ED609F6